MKGRARFLPARYWHRRHAGAAGFTADRQRRGETHGRKGGDTQLRHSAAGSGAGGRQAQRHAGRYAFCQTLDDALILQLAADHDVLVTVEENAIMGGAGSGVNELLMAHRRVVPVLNIGLPDFFIPREPRKKCAPTSALMPPVSKPKSPPGWSESSPLTAPAMLKGYPFVDSRSRSCTTSHLKQPPAGLLALSRLYDLWRAGSGQARPDPA